jgi:hypothetical protein
VQSVSSSAAAFNPLVLRHQDILDGATLDFTMGSQANTTCVAAQFCDTAAKKEASGFVPAPVFLSTSLLFRTNAMVGIVDNEAGAELYYTTDGSNPGRNSERYDGSVLISKTTRIKAIAFSKADTSLRSGITSGTFYKYPNWWSIHVRSRVSAQYSAGGDETLIDGIRGDANWRKGNWLGFQGKDFEAVLDLGKVQSISKLSAGFLQDENSWILMPREVDFFLSSDGKTYKHIVTIDNDVSESDDRVQVKDFSSAIRKQKARYVKVRATNFGKLPEWHPGKGGDAFLFADEITVE